MSGFARTDAQPPRVCPKCGHVANEGDSACRLCFGTLRQAPAAGPREVLARRLTWPRALMLVAVVLGIGFVVYRNSVAPRLIRSVTSSERNAADIHLARTVAVTSDIHAPVVWRVALPALISASPVSDGTRLYVPLVDARVIALAAENGHTVWSHAVPGQLNDSPVVAGDAIYFGQRNGYVVALDAATGAQRWSRDLHDWVEGAPVVVGGAVYVVAGETLTALDAERGTVLWQDEIGVRGVAALAADARSVSVPGSNRFLLYDRHTGQRRFVADAAHVEGVAFQDDAMFALTDGYLVAIDATTESPWWEPFRTTWYNLWAYGLAPAVPIAGHRWVHVDGVESRPPRGTPPSWQDPYPLTFDAGHVFVTWPYGRIRVHDIYTGEVTLDRIVDPIMSAPIMTDSGLLFARQDAIIVMNPATGDNIEQRAFVPPRLDDLIITPAGIVLTTDTEILLITR